MVEEFMLLANMSMAPLIANDLSRRALLRGHLVFGRKSYILILIAHKKVFCSSAVQREANKLVEEFMLLANMSVASLIADAFPERALLRRHPPPNQRKLEEVSNMSNSLVRSIAGIPAQLHSISDYQYSSNEDRA